MHTVRYSADLCIAEGMKDLDAWLLRHEKKSQIPVVHQGQKWIFEEYVYNGEFHEPRLPWRLLSILPCFDLDRERIVYINPNLEWANLIHPGDTVEFYHSSWYECCGSFVVSRIAKTMIQEIGPDELNAWCPISSLEILMGVLGLEYGITLNIYSQVCLMRLRRVENINRSYEPLLLPDPSNK